MFSSWNDDGVINIFYNIYADYVDYCKQDITLFKKMGLCLATQIRLFR